MNDAVSDTSATELEPKNVHEARGWLMDCGFGDDLVDDLTDDQIVRFVDREYDGGWGAFLTDSIGHLVHRSLVTTEPAHESLTDTALACKPAASNTVYLDTRVEQ